MPTTNSTFLKVILFTDTDGRAKFREEALPLPEGTPQAMLDSWLHYLTVSAGQMSTYADFYRNHNINGVYVETLVGPGRPVPVNPPSGGDTGNPPPPPPPPPGADIINPPTGNLNEIPEPAAISMLVVSALAIGLRKLLK